MNEKTEVHFAWMFFSFISQWNKKNQLSILIINFSRFILSLILILPEVFLYFYVMVVKCPEIFQKKFVAAIIDIQNCGLEFCRLDNWTKHPDTGLVFAFWWTRFLLVNCCKRVENANKLFASKKPFVPSPFFVSLENECKILKNQIHRYCMNVSKN